LPRCFRRNQKNQNDCGTGGIAMAGSDHKR
jgi:hypothetical protein